MHIIQLAEWLRAMQSRLQQVLSSSAEIASQQFFFTDLRKSDDVADDVNNTTATAKKMTVLDICTGECVSVSARGVCAYIPNSTILSICGV